MRLAHIRHLGSMIARRSVARVCSRVTQVILPLALISATGQSSPRAQDDFYLHVNRDWFKTARIPPTAPWISPLVVNTLRVQSRINGLIEEVAAAHAPLGTQRQQIGDLYRSYLDQNSIESAGIAPLASELDRISAIRSIDDLVDAFAHLNRMNADFDPANALGSVTPLEVGAAQDAHDAAEMVVLLKPGGLGLPDHQLYGENTTSTATLRAIYLTHIERILVLAGTHQATEASKRVLNLETALASQRLSETQLHDPAATYHPIERDNLSRHYPGLAWPRFLAASGVPDIRRIVIAEPVQLRRLIELMQTEPLETWRDYLRWQLLRRYAPYLPAAFAEADFEFYGKRLLGNLVPVARGERAALLVQGAFGEVVGRLYVDRYLDARAKGDVTNIAERIRAVFRERIAASQWLEPKTKAAALTKLDKLIVKVAYPDKWQEASAVEIRAADLIGNLQRLSTHAYDERIARVGRPVDRTRWLDVPQATGAYYNRSTNELAIPAGYLQPPWYDPNASPAENFGGIGTVIGHEMGHAFDDQGSRFDGDGNLVEWWTSEDRTRFNSRIERLVVQYDRYEPLAGMHVDGRLTISENVGDLTGLTMAYVALFGNKEAASGDLTQKTRFFESFCRHWPALYNKPLLMRLLRTDGHSPQHYRCNGPLSNFTPFLVAYDVRPSDGMYLPPEERVALW